MNEHLNFRRTTDGFYSYTVHDKQKWGYEKKHRGARRKREGFETKTEPAPIARPGWTGSTPWAATPLG